MGTTRGKEVKYECYGAACTLRGCDEHVMRMDFQRTSDVMLFYKDNEILFACDEKTWEAMVSAEDLCGQTT